MKGQRNLEIPLNSILTPTVVMAVFLRHETVFRTPMLDIS